MQNETIFLKDLNYITYSSGILQVIFEYNNLIVRCVCNLFILIFCQKDSQLFVLIHDLMKKAFSFWLILLCDLSDAFLYNQAKLCIVFFLLSANLPHYFQSNSSFQCCTCSLAEALLLSGDFSACQFTKCATNTVV